MSNNNNISSLNNSSKDQIKNQVVDYQLQKNNFRKSKKNEYDLSNHKIYFSSFSEAFGRILILFAQLFFFNALIVFNFIYSNILVNFVPNEGQTLFSQTIMRILFLFGVYVSFILILLYILPFILCTTLKTLRTWSIFFLIIGNIFISFFLLLSFISVNIVQSLAIPISSFLPLLAIILFVTSIFLIFLGTIIIVFKTNSIISRLESLLIHLPNHDKYKNNFSFLKNEK